MQTNSIEGNDQEITEGRHPATGENETVQPDETRIAIVRLVESGAVRRSQISHETNVSKTAVLTWLKGNYKGNNERIGRRMKQWLCDYHELQTKKKPQFDFVHTTVSARIFEVANECRNYGRMAVVTGESGIGKSTAVNEYESSYPNVYVIRAHHRFSVKATFCDLHRSVGLVGEGSIHCLMEDIVSQLRRTKSIIIVDEAEHLEADCLDMIRQIYDRAGTGILYVGLERFRTRIVSLRAQYDYIVNRLFTCVSLNNPTPADTQLLIESAMPDVSQTVVEEFRRLSGGNARKLQMMVFAACRLRQSDNTVTTDDIQRIAGSFGA